MHGTFVSELHSRLQEVVKLLSNDKSAATSFLQVQTCSAVSVVHESARGEAADRFPHQTSEPGMGRYVM